MIINKAMNIENLYYCGQVFVKICSNWIFKLLATSFFVSLEFFFDGLQKQAMLAILALLIFDAVTAMWAANKVGEKLQSHKMFRSAFKTTAYFTLISAAFVAEKAIPLNVIDDTVIAFLATTELISILENTSKAGYAIPTALLEKLKEFSRLK